MKVKFYKIYCTSDLRWESWILKEDAPSPTTCPTNTLHNVDLASVRVVREVGSEFSTSADGAVRTTPTPATEAYEMCDRDMLLKTAVVDARATVLISGADADGHILYASSVLGVFGNSITVEHTAGASGAGHGDRTLDADMVFDGNANLVVTYGTDSNGNPIVPTAGAVAAMLATKYEILLYVVPNLVGDGSGLVQVTAATALTGGDSPSLEDIKINPITFAKGEWNELQQVGCYKLVNGDYIPVNDQNDANTNACLSVWRYCAHHQTTLAKQVIEIRDGLMIVDATIDDSFEHQSYAIGAPQVPVELGGQVLQFDAYLRYYKGEVLGATSPQAKAMDPTLGPGACELRVYIYYPAGAKHTHVLRLVTYRPPGTF